MFARVHTVLFRIALVVTLLFLLVATGLAVTRSRLEPVLSGSMTPAIPRHSLVLAVPVRTADLEVGDVVVFQPPGSASSVMHRVVELTDRDGVRVMRTRGDANPVIDPWTVDLGGPGVLRVKAAVPRAGVVLQFLHNTTRHTGGELTWPGLLLLIGAIGYAIRLRRRDDEPDDGTDDGTDGAPAGADVAAELRAAGRDLAGCAERLDGAALDPERARAVRTVADHAERIAALADRLAAPVAATPAGKEADRYTPRHGRGTRSASRWLTGCSPGRPPRRT